MQLFSKGIQDVLLMIK